ncbi:hypothetical protein C5610_03425 [Idiomarina sp. OT37-5b]|nr:hypothetical protein C5610_03425 [Idiomarina sp. OT37-5b]
MGFVALPGFRIEYALRINSVGFLWIEVACGGRMMRLLEAGIFLAPIDAACGGGNIFGPDRHAAAPLSRWVPTI